MCIYIVIYMFILMKESERKWDIYIYRCVYINIVIYMLLSMKENERKRDVFLILSLSLLTIPTILSSSYLDNNKLTSIAPGTFYRQPNLFILYVAISTLFSFSFSFSFSLSLSLYIYIYIYSLLVPSHACTHKSYSHACM